LPVSWKNSSSCINSAVIQLNRSIPETEDSPTVRWIDGVSARSFKLDHADPLPEGQDTRAGGRTAAFY